jgi:predicted RNA-binding Zn ribbon-like protein
MDNKERSAGNLELIGGSLCLDFVNTLSARSGKEQREYLTTYREWVTWSQHAGLLTADQAKRLLRSAARRPDRAAATLERAIGVRETLYRVLAAVANDREPQGGDLAALNQVLHEALSRRELGRSAGGFVWHWVVEPDELERVLWPVVYSAGELLTSVDLGRVQQCARDGCDWLFVDTSKNRSRRWCSMEACGSRVKARRYYRRKRGKS